MKPVSNDRPSGHGRRGGHFRRGKLFDSSELQLLILHLVGEEARHGYELMREIEERSNGAYAPSPGVVYPTLTLLTELGLIAEAESDGVRKSYRISEAGKTMLDTRAKDVSALFVRLASIGEKAARTDAAPIRRAMGNLRQVVMDRLSKPETTEADVLDVARVIDETASKIERM